MERKTWAQSTIIREEEEIQMTLHAKGCKATVGDVSEAVDPPSQPSPYHKYVLKYFHKLCFQTPFASAWSDSSQAVQNLVCWSHNSKFAPADF